MTLVELHTLDAAARAELATLTLAATRPQFPDWLPDLDAARALITDALAPGKLTRVLLDAGHPIAWIAAGHAWGRVWEIHPLIVALDHQQRGHGRRLVREVEQLAAATGALTMTLSTSDTTGATSLTGADLYHDTFTQLAELTAHHAHAVTFWRRIGYQVVGVLPDAEAPGQPSISLARRL